MAVRQTADALTIGHRVSDALPANAGVTGLWVREVCGNVEVYLTTLTLDGDGERRIFSTLVDVPDMIPDIDVEPVVLNPRFFEPDTDLMREIPSDAQPVPLRP